MIRLIQVFKTHPQDALFYVDDGENWLTSSCGDKRWRDPLVLGEKHQTYVRHDPCLILMKGINTVVRNKWYMPGFEPNIIYEHNPVIASHDHTVSNVHYL